MRSIVAAALVALAIAVVGSVGAKADAFPEGFFQQLQLNGN